MNVKGVRFQFLMAVALVSAIFPMNLALAQGEQMAEQALMSQLTDMDVGQITLHKSGNDFTITRPDGSFYEFTNVVRHKSGASGIASIYNAKGALIDSITIHSGTNVPDQNRINFSTSRNGELTTGSITGLKSPGQAIASIDKDGSSKLMRMDYSGMDTRVRDTQRGDTEIRTKSSSSQMISLSSMEVETRLGKVAALFIIAVVLFIGATCLFLGWWGC